MTRSRIDVAVAICACLLAAACHDPDRYLLSPTAADEFLRVEVSAPTLVADGVSRVVLTAILDDRTAAANRKVTFKTTLGSLYAGTEKGVPSVTVDADSSGRAVAELQSETTIGTARVEVGVGPADNPAAVVRVVDVPFVALAPDSAFTVTATPPSIAADGFSRSVIRVQLLPAAGSTQRSVTFTAFTTGLLFGVGESAGALSKTVTANSDGIAVVELQSSRNLETARVQATALGVTREVEVTFSAANPDDIIRLSVSASTAPADGASIVRVTATVAAGLASDRREVHFTTTLGTFANGTTDFDATADGANRAVVDLKTEQKTGIANLRATLVDDQVSDAASVQFVPALPDRIVVSADDGEVNATQDVAITARLFRNVGTPTTNTVVTYSAVTAGGAPVGIFSDVEPSSMDGVSTATFTPGASAPLGRVTIRASVNNTIVGSTVIEIVGP